ncbi:MAG: hypothetical protein CSA04_03835, partial [Bacteroidetes bacterium]
MLNRRQLRLKVVQAVYAYEQSGNDRVDAGERELFDSLRNIDKLFTMQLSLLLELADFAARHMEEAKHKFFPTEEEKNPSTRFVDNRLFALLRANPTYQNRRKGYKIDWRDQEEMVRKLFLALRSSAKYKTYLYSEKDSFVHDRSFVEKLYMDHFVANEDIESYYEERNIHWASDYDIVNNLVLRYIKNMRAPSSGEGSTFSALFPADVMDSDRELRVFVKELFVKTITHREAHIQLIADRANNWEFERIAVMDKILLRMAVTEIMLFPSIPIKVTLNEYIELSKIFSTP